MHAIYKANVIANVLAFNQNKKQKNSTIPQECQQDLVRRVNAPLPPEVKFFF